MWNIPSNKKLSKILEIECPVCEAAIVTEPDVIDLYCDAEFFD